MSDVSQGPGWWQASDGCWYPPNLAPRPSTPPGRRRRRIVIAIVAFVVLLGVFFLLSTPDCGCTNPNVTTTTATNP
jgi:hypothetical protein